MPLTAPSNSLFSQAWTGELRGVFGSGGPLVRPSVPASGDGHTFESNQSDDEKMAIVPGFDGSLYWISDEEPATNSGEGGKG